MTLQAVWFILIFVLLAGYAILDGMDFGVGALHLFTREERGRRQALQVIGPTWDGNEVWLLTGGGALFAAFPPVYATVFSGFYLALVLLLVALIARAVAVEFRSKTAAPRWRACWDWAFGLGSIVPALLLGVALGNILRGVPINAAGDYTGTFFDLLNPYALLVGALSLAAFTMHGAVALAHKTAGPDADRFARLAPWLGWIVLALFAATAAISLTTVPHLRGAVESVWGLAPLTLAAVGLVAAPILSHGRRFGAALVASSAAIGSMIALAGAAIFPRLVPSSTDLAWSLTAQNSSSTPGTLTAMLIIALVGMPVVLAYTVYVHWLFRGKVTVEDEGY
jgi:cytochrome bd ubiquinol oxidase subunit II